MENLSFLDIPKNVVEEILKLDRLMAAEPCYRILRNVDANLKSEDFMPTFKDEKQMMHKNKGAMANEIMKAPVDLPHYALSIFLNKEKLKNIFWRKPHTRKEFPAIAKGKIDSKKGYAHLDKEYHISYYLFDFINNNPVVDFILDEICDCKEDKINHEKTN